MKFEVSGINCQNCANLIKNSLEDEFGAIEIDMSLEPKVVSCELKPEQVSQFIAELRELGFEVSGQG